MQSTKCDVPSYTGGVCHFITSNPLQTISAHVWMQQTSFSMLPIRTPDFHFTFDNLNDIDNYGATLVPGKVSLKCHHVIQTCSNLTGIS